MSVDTRSASLISSGAVMAAGTMLSRLMGVVRAVLIALVLGNGTRQAEMFTLANTIPTSLYILFAGGALNTVLVPQIVRATERDADRGEAYTNRIMTAFLAIIAGVTLVLLVAAPLVLRIYTADDWRTPEFASQYESMLVLVYLCLPQVFFYGAFFLAGQVLNARGRFGPMMWAPIANNLVAIAVFSLYLLVFSGDADHSLAFTSGQQLMLGGGATLGIVVQTAILIPFLRRAGFVYRPRFDFRHTGLGHTFALAKWTLGFVVVLQLALVVVNRLASSATTQADVAGGLTVYNNAYLIWILPHSVITVSLATAMVPAASRLATTGDLAGVAAETTRTIRLASSVLLPAAVAFAVLAQPIARLPFGFGEGATDYPLVGWTLLAFAVGLVPFTIQYICLRAFYALEDTRTTFFLQLLISGANAGLAVLLVYAVDDPRLVAAALGLSYSLAYLLGVLVTYRVLRRKLPDLVGSDVLRHLVRVGLAILPSAVVAWLITYGIGRLADGRLASAGALALAGVAAVGLYLLMARVLRIEEIGEIVNTVLRRGGGRGGDTDHHDTDQHDTNQHDTDQHDVGQKEAAERDAEQEEGRVAQHEDERLPPASATPPAPGATPPMTPAEAARAHHLDLDTAAMDPVDLDGHPMSPSSGPALPTEWEEDEPTTGSNRLALTDPDVLRGSHQKAGDVLGRRYRLEEIIAGRADTHTWRAFDQVLSRSVLVQVLPPDDPRSPALLEAARASAVATDSRFLRVLDAVYSEDPELGSYIVTEFSAGQTLEVMLTQGPLSALEAAWLVREAADALAGMHAAGLYHQHLGPDAITITPAGNLKITGFLLDAAIDPEGLEPSDDQPGRSEGPEGAAAPSARSGEGSEETGDPVGDDRPGGEATDVRDLGRLLYAALVSRWPGSARYGLERAPGDGGRLLTPRQVRHGVSPALDRITDQILGPVPRHHEPVLTSAAEVSQALSTVLGTADASHDLERRVRQPVPVVGNPRDTGLVPTVPPEASSPVSALAPATPRSALVTRIPETAEASGVRVVDAAHPVRRRWLGVLVVLLVLALISGLVAVAIRNQAQFTGNAPAETVAPPGPVTVQQAIVFDPEGDPPGDENNETAELAVDGDPTTAWETVYYRGNPQLGGLKRGVGLVLDLGEVTDVTRLQVLLPEQPTALEILAPSDRSTTEPPLDSDEDWETLATEDAASGETTFTLDEAVSTRFVLVYLTSLPPSSTRYQGLVYEVEVTG